MQHLVNREIEALACAGVVIRKLMGLDELALGVLDLDRDRVDADQFLQPLAVAGVALEADGIALDQELQHHVLDKGEDTQLAGELERAGLHLLLVAGKLDLVAHGEGAPRVDAVLHQRLFEVVLPGLARPVLPRRRDRLGGVDPVERRGVEGGGRAEGDEDVSVGFERRGFAARCD